VPAGNIFGPALRPAVVNSRLSRAVLYCERSSFKASNNKWSDNNEQ
jgi:hypothetical protein